MPGTSASRYVAVIDAGTSSLRCLVFDSDHEVVSSRATSWPYLTTTHISTFAREFDPRGVWSAACRLLRAVLADADVSVSAITATGQRQALAFLDASGDEIYVGPNLDLRAVFEGGAIDEGARDRVYGTTGHAPTFMLGPAKLRWFQLNRPNAYDRIAAAFTLADWLLFKLSGELVSEPSLAGDAGLLDIHSRDWCTDLFADLGLKTNDSVSLVDAGTRVGGVTARASEDTGLPQGTPVVVSGADTQCGLLGMGIADPREAGVVAGWSVPVQVVTDGPRAGPSSGMWSSCHVTPDRWVVESTTGDAGNSYNWLKSTVWGDEKGAFKDMDDLAGRVLPGSEGVVVFLGPSRMDANNLGLKQGGIYFPVPVSHNEIGRGHLARAALEAIAYAVRSNVEQAEGLVYGPVTDMAVGGGMVQSSTWTKLLADVLGRQAAVSPAPNVSALGASLCAGVGLGEFRSLEETADGVSGRLNVIEPNAANSAEYDDYYARWTDMSSRLEEMPL